MNDRNLPAGWVTTTLDSLCLPVDKVAPRKDAPDQPFTYLDITSIDNKTFRVVSPKIYMGRDAPSRARQKVRRGNTLFSTVRTYLKNIAMVPPEFDGEVASTGFCVLNPACGVDQKFIFYLVLNDEFTSNLNPLQRGTSYPAVRNDDVLAQEILLPPLAEQHRIVAAIEQHLTRLAAAVTALKQVQANLQRYRTSLLKTACEGKLVPTEAALARAEGRDYEHADRLLARILVERRARWAAQPKRRGKYKEPTPPDTPALPRLPEGWAWARLDQITWSLDGGTAVPATGKPSSRLVLRSSAVRQGILNLDDHRFLPHDAPRPINAFISTGDLLFTRLSGSLNYVGNCAVVGELHGRRMEFPDRIFRGRCTDSISPHFVQLCFGERTLRQALEAKAKSTAGHQRISLSDLRLFHVPLPPLAEQHRIVAEVERRLSIIRQAEAAVEASLKRAERLRQSILKQAFSGQLVPQDPNDEPAAVLLACIQAERAAAEAAAKAQRKPRRRRPRRTPARQLSLAEGTP